jgi:quinoprotein glucose dehydrogenase
VTSWIDPNAIADSPCRHRIFVGTLDARLIALDGANGKPCADFGDKGEIFLDRDIRVLDDEWVNYTVTSPPVVVDDIVVIGSAIGDNVRVESELGIVRGIDARTGEERWRWDPIPRNADERRSSEERLGKRMGTIRGRWRTGPCLRADRIREPGLLRWRARGR